MVLRKLIPGFPLVKNLIVGALEKPGIVVLYANCGTMAPGRFLGYL